MDISEIQAYVYFAGTILIVGLLYAYFYHLYTAKKKSGKDYEQYGMMALNDGLHEQPIEKIGS